MSGSFSPKFRKQKKPLRTLLNFNLSWNLGGTPKIGNQKVRLEEL